MTDNFKKFRVISEDGSPVYCDDDEVVLWTERGFTASRIEGLPVSVLEERDKLREEVKALKEALKPFARYERVRIDPVIKTNGRSLVPKTGDIWVTCAAVDDEYTEAAITVDDMTKARELTGI